MTEQEANSDNLGNLLHNNGRVKLESPRSAILISTHNTKFHDKIRKFH